MPGGTNAPKDWPAEPWKWSRMVSSGSPAGPCRRVTSEPTMVPTTRLVLRMGSVARTGLRSSMAGLARSSSAVASSVRSMPWSCGIWQVRP